MRRGCAGERRQRWGRGQAMASLAPKGLMCMREREKTRSEKSRNRGRKRKENKGLDEQFLLVLGVKGGPEEDEWSARVQLLLPAASLVGSMEENQEERWRLLVGWMGKTRWIWQMGGWI